MSILQEGRKHLEREGAWDPKVLLSLQEVKVKLRGRVCFQLETGEEHPALPLCGALLLSPGKYESNSSIIGSGLPDSEKVSHGDQGSSIGKR